MLRIPPGIEKRSGLSKTIEEAGAVFDSLYKKYISTENIQKQAENYLLKSLYNKTVLKQKAPPTPSEPAPDAAASEDAPVDISKLVDFYQNLPTTSKPVHSHQNLPTTSKPKSGNHVSFEHGSRLVKQRQLSSDNLASDAALHSSLGASANDSALAHSEVARHELDSGLGSPQPLGLHSSQPSKSDRLLSANRPGSVSFADNFSDVSEDPQSKNYIKFKKVPQQDKHSDEPSDEFFNEPPHGKHSKYYSSSVSKRRDTIYVSTICVLLQSLLFVTLLSVFLLLNARILSRPLPNEPAAPDAPAKSAPGAAAAAGEPKEPGSAPGLRGAAAAAGDGARPGGGLAAADSADPLPKEVGRPRAAFLGVSFPFVLHFVLFYLVFSAIDSYLRRRQLLYSNDVTLAVVSKRLHRELSFSKLNAVTFWFDKGVLVLAVVIACLPFSGSYNIRSWGKTEFVYLSLVIVFFILHVAYSLYYFNFKFVQLVLSEKSDH